MTTFERIAAEVQAERDRWEKIRAKSLLGRIRYNRKYRPIKRWARFLGKWIPKANQSTPSWTSYIATFDATKEG